MPLFLALISCADSDNINNSSNDNNTVIDNSTGTDNNPAPDNPIWSDGNVEVPLFKENSITAGTTTVSYDTNQTFHTLMYSAQSPATDNYSIFKFYTISSGGQNWLNTQTANNTLSSSQNLAAKLNVDSSLKNKIIDINKYTQDYAFNNNIKPMSKNSSVLYRTIPQTVDIGTKWENIHLLNVDNNTFSTINATCIAVSQYAYFFLQDGLDNLTEEQITSITTAFDKDYSIIHQYYGEETDTDGNGKVSFLIASFPKSLLGFFFTPDKYLQQNIPADYKSNEADVLYVNHYYFINGNWEKYETDLKATFIHEFQHMVLFDTRTRNNLNSNLNLWLNEGLSMLAEYYAGYAAPHYRYIQGYFKLNQGKSLISDDSSLDYGLSYLFARYLQIRFGDGFIKSLYASQHTGIKAVEEATNMDFNELYLDFIKMIFVTGRNITTDPKYNIEEFNHAAGTVGYARNGFNLAALIDETYSSLYNYNSDNKYFSSFSHSNELEMYGFQITKWNGIIDSITLSGNGGIAGMYAAWW